jgi:hypothetical protein
LGTATGVRWEALRAPLVVAVSYADADRAWAEELRLRLQPLVDAGLVSEAGDRESRLAAAGEEPRSMGLGAAQLVLALVSPESLASDFCRDEFEHALKRSEQGECTVIPILLRPAPWHESPLSRYQSLPADGIPIAVATDRERAWQAVVAGIRQAALEGGQAVLAP